MLQAVQTLAGLLGIRQDVSERFAVLALEIAQQEQALLDALERAWIGLDCVQVVA
jgi:hypothetical protein